MAVTYTLRYRPVGTEDWTEETGLTGTSHALTGLEPGVRYDIEVVAVSDAGARSAAVVAQRSTRCAAPAQPTALPAGHVLSSGDPGTNGRLDTVWGAVAGAVSYVVRTRPTGVGGYTAFGSPVEGLATTVTGLDGAASYDVEVAAVNVDGDVSAASSARTAVPARVASGGAVTTFAGDGTIGESGRTYVVHSFATTGSATFTLNRDLVVSHLVVAGGGGGGHGFDGGPGGGGGAGGLVAGALSRSAGALAVTVGAGGAGGVSGTSGGAGGQGSNSVLGDITAVGGGAGGASRANGGNGGSGGGSGGRHILTDYLGGLALGQGNDGAQNPGATGAGGGGGSGGAAAAPTTTAAGAGGAGSASSITGSSVTYATGGAGGSRAAQSNGVAATSGRGDGGSGGSSDVVGTVVGGAGGSGVVVLRYALPVLADLTAPTGVAALPAGRTGGAATGAVEVTWASVGAGATYEVQHRPITPTVGGWTSVDAGSATRLLITGLDPARTYEATVTATAGGATSSASQPLSARAVIATGGSIATFTGNGATDGTLTNAAGVTYVVHTFATVGSATFALNRSIDVEHLVIAGGGGGGSRHGGGGGAGGMVSGSAARGSDAHPTGSVVTVGAGGAGTPAADQGTSALPTAGSDSSAVGVTATGGGSGGGSSRGTGTNGGSGGGSSGSTADPGTGSSGQGSAGGRGTNSTPWAGGGGGGAGGAGQSPSGQVAGAGGAGRSTVIAGNSGTTFAGGGGGSTTNGTGAGAAGSGGGGAGAFGYADGGNATSATGGGGGGGGFDDTRDPDNRKGGDGGSGRVVLRYRLPA